MRCSGVMMNAIQRDIEQNPAPNVTDPETTWGQMTDMFSHLYSTYEQEFEVGNEGGYVPLQEPVRENDARGRHLEFNANNIVATAWAYSQQNETAGGVAPDIVGGNIDKEQENLSPGGVRRAVSRSSDVRLTLMGFGLNLVKLCHAARRFLQNHGEEEEDDYFFCLDDVSRELQILERGIVGMDVTLVCETIYELHEAGSFDDM